MTWGLPKGGAEDRLAVTRWYSAFDLPLVLLRFVTHFCEQGQEKIDHMNKWRKNQN